MKADKYTKMQPEDGDNVLHCGHIEHSHCHFFFAPAGISFLRSDTREVQIAKWIVGCQSCLDAVGFDPTLLVIRGSVTWSGTEPGIEVNPNRPPEYPRK